MPSVGARADAGIAGLEQLPSRDLTSRSSAVTEAVPFSGSAGSASVSPLMGNGEGGMDDRFSEGTNTV